MSTPQLDLEAAVSRWAEAQAAAMHDHPSLDELMEYVGGEASAWLRDAIQEHLSCCPECTRTVIDLATFPEVDLVEPRQVPDQQAADDWRKLEASLATLGPGVEPDIETPTSGDSWVRWGLAAALLVMVLGAAWGLLSGSDTSDPTAGGSRSLRNVHVWDLVPVADAVSRQAGSEEVLVLPERAEHLLLILNLTDLRDLEDYRLELRGPGETRVDFGGLARGPEGNFTVLFPRDQLPPGPLELDLLGSAAGREELLASYRLLLEGPPIP